MNNTRLSQFVICRGLSNCISKVIHFQKEDKPVLAYSKTPSSNVVVWGLVRLEYFKKHTVKKHTVNSANNKTTINESTINNLIKFKVKQFTVSEKRLLIIDGYSFHCSIEFFQFSGDHSIRFLCLSSHATYFLQPLDVEIFESLANVYCLECHERVLPLPC